MFEKVLSQRAIGVIEYLSSRLEIFYLASGTALALQLGHRRSDDMDFFSEKLFNTDAILSLISVDKVFLTSLGTIHCEVKGIRVSFLYYDVPLLYPTLSWHGIQIAHYKDIVAEKIKTISQQGSKKDFIDLYAALKMKRSVLEVCEFFKKRFEASNVNFYHVLRSLIFFEDPEQEPLPPMVLSGDERKWENVKSFFIHNINSFERGLGS